MSIKDKLQELLEASDTIKAASKEIDDPKADSDNVIVHDGEEVDDNEESQPEPTEPDSEELESEEEKEQKKSTKGKGMTEEIKVDVSEDIDALFNGETLTEEFKDKATTIFEAAVVSRVKAEVQELDEIYATQVKALQEQTEEKMDALEKEFAQKLDEQVEEAKDGLVEHVDGFLNYIVEQWIKDNEVALETGIRHEIAENVVTGLHKLFSENFVHVPEEKTDLVEELESHLETAIDKLDEQLKINIELTKTINEGKRESMVEKFTQGLTDVDAEKFKTLVEELSYDSAEKFQGKLETIKENYFTKKAVKQESTTSIAITDEPVTELKEETSPKLNPVMSAYLKQMSR